MKASDNWRARQKHDDDFFKVCRDLGFMDSEGRMRRYDGKAFFHYMENLGHDYALYEDCKCRLVEITE